MAVKTENTMAEGLQSIMTDVAMLKMTADADLGFLVQLENMILGYMRQGMDQGVQQGANPGSQMGTSPMSMPPGMPPGGSMGASPLAASAMLGGGSMGPTGPGGPGRGGPNTDEIARLLS